MSKVVLVPFAVLALSVALVGCDGDGDTINVSPPAVTVDAPPPPNVTINQPTPVPTATLTATVSGRVIDSATGVAIPGATVTANIPGVAAAVQTDALGSFALQNLPRTEANSPLILTVTGGTPPPGRVYPSTTNAVVSLTSATAGDPVEPLVVLAGVEIELHDRGGIIEGTVLNVSGNPAAGISVTLDVVQIPVITPGVGLTGPSTGIFPFALDVAPGQGAGANTRTATTNANGVFRFEAVPEDWIYNIIIVPGGGAANVIFTNQYVPSGSRLAFPDFVGAPADSAVVQAFGLAGVFPGLGGAPGLPGPLAGALAPMCAGAPCAAPFVAGGPVAIIPAILPGDQADMTPPFVVDNSPLVDGTFIAQAQNTPGLQLRFTVSEPLGNTRDQLANGLMLLFRGAGAVPGGGVGPGTPIPFDVSVSGNTVTLTPQVFGGTGNPIPLAAGIYAIAGLGTLIDAAGNPYTGLTPNPNTRPAMGMPPMGMDAASVIGGVDFEIDFVILGDSTLPGAPSAANIMCTNCDYGTTAGITLTFNEVAGAVQYFGALATEGDTVFTFMDAAGMLFASAGPLANPPEAILNFSTDMPVGAGPNMPLTLAGFQFPLVAGTETDGLVANNYFDDGIRYQFGVQAVNNQGILGPLTTVLLGDSVAPGLNTGATGLAGAIGAAGVGNDINATVGAGTVSAMSNTTTPFALLENFFATSAMGDMTADTVAIVEGAMPATAVFDFADVTGTTDESMTLGFVNPGGVDIFYSAADYMAVVASGALANRTLTIQADEDLASGVTPMLPTFTSVTMAGLPAFTAAGADVSMAAATAAAFDDGVAGAITAISLPADTDMIMDENLIRLTLDDIRRFTTGDLVDLGSTGITDEAGNPIAGTVRIANALPGAITTATARQGANNTHELVITTNRPMVFDAGTVNAMNVLQVGLGLTNADGTVPAASPIGGMAALSADNRTLTITGIDPMGGVAGLSDVTITSVLDGTGLSTNDPLNFQALGNFPAGLPINAFEVAAGAPGGRAAIIIQDQIGPRIVDEQSLATSAQDAVGGVPNGVALNTVQMNADGFWSVGDVVMAGDMIQTFQVAVTFSEPVFEADAMGDFAPDARASLTFALAPAAVVGGVANPDPAMYAISMDAMVSIPAAPNNMTAVLQFDLNLGTVAIQDTLTITVTDLSGNAIDPNGNEIRLGVIGAPTGFTVE